MQPALAGALALLTALSVISSGDDPEAAGAGAPPQPPSALALTPGCLAAAQTPQFVLLTHDDAVNGKALQILRSITDGRNSRGGCLVAATLFAMLRNTGEHNGPVRGLRRRH